MLSLCDKFEVRIALRVSKMGRGPQSVSHASDRVTFWELVCYTLTIRYSACDGRPIQHV